MIRNPIFARGAQSAIAQELDNIWPVRRVERDEQMPDTALLYLFCAGLIRQKRIADQTEAEIAETMNVNAISVILECERLLAVNPKARICVIGSESAFKGSFDHAYATAKAALHRYVETKRLPFPDQQLVCIAPTHILNTGMCSRRNADGVELMEKRRKAHQKQRWLEPFEVARLVHFLLCQDQGYITNTVIRMNGGQHL
jgi:NAD(P)-dependent dehydrogenase (short-subunit alcohol dehydrogenase family)